MKQWKNLYSKLCSWENLYSAAYEAARGKKKSALMDRFFLNLESNLLSIQKKLREKEYKPAPYYQFTIYDPKKRVISAAPFHDRVVHHAICSILEPCFENYFIAQSYACRKDKGSHLAIEIAKKYASRYPYFLKMDIAKFYDSVKHSILIEHLKRFIGDSDLIWLLESIIDFKPSPQAGFGLPIGNLTSQYFANFILSWVDHYAKEILQIRAYLRYMDDFLIFCEEKEDMKYVKAHLEEYLPKELELSWKQNATILAPVKEGIPYLGLKIFPYHTKILKKNAVQFKKRLKRKRWEYQNGKISLEEFQLSTQSLLSYISQANSFHYRSKFFSTFSCDF